LKEGWQLAVVYHTSQEVAEELKRYGEVEGIKADLSDFFSYQRVVAQTVERFGRVDGLLHLASPYYPTPLESLSLEDLMNHLMPIATAFLF
jgi:pteridine reductase